MNNIIETDKLFVANTYNRFPIEITGGKGSIIYSADGKKYIDMGTGIACNTFGLSDKKWVKTVTKQLKKFQHTSNLYYTEPCAKLAQTLCDRTGMKKVFFGNSGAEANECAIKVARKYAEEKKGGDYNYIITLKNSFHGRTITTLSATGQEGFHKSFQPLTAGFDYANANDIDSVKELTKKHKVAGVLIELVQGEGGVNALDYDFVKGIEKLCHEQDIVFMVDEVQTGNGRTGELYGFIKYGVMPDIVTTAKGLGNGLPIGACMMGEKVQGVLKFGDHGSTFGGNPVSSAGAINIINRIDDAVLAGVRARSSYIISELKGAKGVQSVTGMGLMLGVKTDKPAKDVLQKCMDNGVLFLTAKDKIRLLPALNIPMKLLERAVAVLKQACAE